MFLFAETMYAYGGEAEVATSEFKRVFVFALSREFSLSACTLERLIHAVAQAALSHSAFNQNFNERNLSFSGVSTTEENVWLSVYQENFGLQTSVFQGMVSIERKSV